MFVTMVDSNAFTSSLMNFIISFLIKFLAPLLCHKFNLQLNEVIEVIEMLRNVNDPLPTAAVPTAPTAAVPTVAAAVPTVAAAVPTVDLCSVTTVDLCSTTPTTVSTVVGPPVKRRKKKEVERSAPKKMKTTPKIRTSLTHFAGGPKTVKQLKEIAEDLGIKVPSKIRKAELQDLIQKTKDNAEAGLQAFIGCMFKCESGNIWKIGSFVQKGAFGSVYNVALHERCDGSQVSPATAFVVKIEKHSYTCTLKVEREVYEKLRSSGGSTNIPTLISHGMLRHNSEKYQYIVLPKLDYTLVDCRSSIRVEDLHALVTDIMIAIKDLHGVGYCHLDIKPHNIMYCKTSNKWYLLDLGLCKPAPVGFSTRKATCGTPNYMARNAHIGLYSRKSDIESFLFSIIYASGLKLEWMSLTTKDWKDEMYKMKCQFIEDREINTKHLRSIKGVVEILSYFNET